MKKFSVFLVIMAFLLAFVPQSFSQEQTAPPATQIQSTLMASEDFEAAMRLYRQRRYAEASAAFEQITQADPNNAAAFYFAGYAHYVQGHHPESQAAFEKAFQVNPAFNPRPYFQGR